MTKVAAVLCFVLAIVAARPARAQKFEVIHTFHNGKGPQNPTGQLILDKEGNLYGVAGGGLITGWWYANAGGTVFKMNKTGKLLWTYRFDGPDGWGPGGALLRDSAGDLLGATGDGGKEIGRNGACDVGCGLLYKLDKTGKKETVLYKFTGVPPTDGYNPFGSLVEDSSGALYGVASGGDAPCGVVFKVDRSGRETVLYNFQCGTDGWDPVAGVVRDSAGNLYGATFMGGDLGCGYQEDAGCGTVFKVDPNGTETVLYSFPSFGGSDGSLPIGGLIRDSEGNLYGTTGIGGSTQSYYCGAQAGCGVVFELSPNADGTWTYTTLYEFCSGGDCSSGSEPRANLIRDKAGNLYGTASRGGVSQQDCCGVVFKLDPTGHETVLHAFTGGSDGSTPYEGLVMDSAGTLYGVATWGGDLNCQAKYGGCGTVFKITP